MQQSQVAALLGRPLSPNEVTNLDVYIDIAEQALESLLCSTLSGMMDSSDLDTILYDAGQGYGTGLTDIFAEVDEVKADGVVPTDCQSRQSDRRNGSWYNSIVFGCKFTREQEVEVPAN